MINKVPPDEITHLDEDDMDVWSCNNCGAHSLTGPEDIKHHTTCIPGEAKYWEEFYQNADDEDPDELDMSEPDSKINDLSGND